MELLIHRVAGEDDAGMGADEDTSNGLDGKQECLDGISNNIRAVLKKNKICTASAERREQNGGV